MQKLLKGIIVAALLSLVSNGRASSAPGEVQSFTIKNGLILELFNVAQQNNGNVASWPAGLNPAVVQATVQNISGTDQPLCFQLVVQEVGVPCSSTVTPGASLVWSPVISTKDVIKAGETRALTAIDFVADAGNAFEGALCTSFQDSLENDFQGTDAADFPKVVDRLLKRVYKVCLVPVACGGGSNNPVVSAPGMQCSSLTLIQPNPGAQASVAMLIYPHNNEVPFGTLNFLWTPALYPGLSSDRIRYVIEIAEQLQGEPLARIAVPKGQTFYQWSPRDKDLEAGKQYYWRVISMNASGATFGGPDGRGWNIQKWFRVKGGTTGPCSYTLADLEHYVNSHAQGNVKAFIKGMGLKNLRLPEGSTGTTLYNDPDICALLSGKAELKAINVSKK